MRKSILLILLAFIVNVLISDYSEAATVIDGSKESTLPAINYFEPPFYMLSYNTFSDLRDDQKEFFLQKFGAEVVKVPTLSTLTKEQLKEASQWAQSWQEIRRKVYEHCRDKGTEELCESLAEIRIQTFNMYSNQKLENRIADEEEAAAKKAAAEKKSEDAKKIEEVKKAAEVKSAADPKKETQPKKQATFSP
jgi:hypothetical protein